MNPNHPIYIPTKGRANILMTSGYLTQMGVRHNLIVEEQEREQYEANTKDNTFATVLTLPKKYQEEYQTLDNLGDKKSKGPGPARNFAWDHSKQKGAKWHWVMDDNIRGFYRLNKNIRILVSDGSMFKAMEDFTERYENVLMSGPAYYTFVHDNQKVPPFVINTRIYSCNLIRNDAPYRWRGRYNEDTILSLDMLHDGYCTIEFNAFLQLKVRTQTIKGGNTGEFYAKEGTYYKTKMLYEAYPQYVRIVKKFKRIHHYINYRKYFHANELILKKGLKIPEGNNEYGMRYHQIKLSKQSKGSENA